MKNTVPKDLLFESTGIHLFCPIAIAVFFFFLLFWYSSWTGDFAEQSASGPQDNLQTPHYPVQTLCSLCQPTLQACQLLVCH